MKSLKRVGDMTNKIKALIAVVSLLLMTSLSPAYGAFVNGEIEISGDAMGLGFVPSDGAMLSDATGIDFLEATVTEGDYGDVSLGAGGTYISGTSGGSFTVDYWVTGNFAHHLSPSPFLLGSINDFNFGNSIASLWNIGGFSFDLQNSSLYLQNPTTLILTGSGEIYGNGFERTRGDILFTGYAFGSSYYWSMKTTATGVGVSVPESSSIYLLAFGLLGLFGAARRKV